MQVTPEQETAAGVMAEEQQAADDAAKWLQERSRVGQMSYQVAERRQQAVAACVDESLQRAGGAAMCVIARCHALLIALRNRGIDNSAMLERSNHLPERMHGARLAIESVIDELGVDRIVAKHAGEFDCEQLEHDVRKELLHSLREML